jgi:hypothetical protein
MPTPTTAVTISPIKYSEAIDEIDRWKKKYNSLQTVGEEKAGLVSAGVTIVGVEAGLGYLRGRYGKKEIAGFAVELLAGGAGELVALSGVLGKHSEAAANLSHATLAFAAAFELYEVGVEARQKADAAPATKPANGAATERKETITTSGETVGDNRRAAPEELPSGQRRTEVVPRPMADDITRAGARKTGT